MHNYDIIIIGGGIAGSLAATASARLGAKTLLVEETGCLGGCLTSSGTGPMMTFHAGDEQVVKGLGQELITRLMKKGLSPGHTIDSTGYTYTVTPFDAEGMKRELELMVLEAGATILYHAMLSGVNKENGLITSVDLLSCAKHFTVKGKIFIDATGDGDLFVLAGIPYHMGRDEDGKNQPMTMNFRLRYVDIAKVRGIMASCPNLFPFLKAKAGIEKRAVRLSCSGFQDLMRKGINTGEITFDRDIVLFFEDNTPGEVIVNMTRINNLSPVDPLELSEAESEGRRQVWELFGYLRKAIPGFEDAQMVASGPNIGIRSSRRLVSKYDITGQDILKETRFDDRICAFGYPIDIHSSDGTETKTTFLRNGAWYTIPYRSLINDTVKNVLAAGRNIGSTFEAQASLRCSPNCASLGQAAGTAAAIAVQDKKLPEDIDIRKLQTTLESMGSFF